MSRKKDSGASILLIGEIIQYSKCNRLSIVCTGTTGYSLELFGIGSYRPSSSNITSDSLVAYFKIDDVSGRVNGMIVQTCQFHHKSRLVTHNIIISSNSTETCYPIESVPIT